MTLAIHSPEDTTVAGQKISPVQTLQGEFVPVRLRFKWWGVRKTLTETQKNRAAQAFGADGDAISGGKRLIDTKSDVYRGLTRTRSQCRNYWQANTLPFPEDGIRMLKAEQVELFVFEMELFRAQLEGRVAEMQGAWAGILSNAEGRLGELWNPSDYPTAEDLPGMFQIEWDFPSVKPDEQLQVIDPALYEKERQKMVARFEVAANMAEDMFTTELSNLVDHLIDRLQPDEEGKAKTIRSSSVDNLNAFFETFASLNLGGNQKLEGLVTKAKQVVNGVDLKEVRKSEDLKKDLSAKLSAVSSELDGMLVNKPRRKILD